MRAIIKTTSILLGTLASGLTTPFALANNIGHENLSNVRVWSFNMEGWAHQSSDMMSKYNDFLTRIKTAGNFQAPDFIATQENYGQTHNNFYLSLDNNTSYTYQQYGRGRDNAGGETNAIIYNSSTWQLIPQVNNIENTLNKTTNLQCDYFHDDNNLTCQLPKGSDGYNRIVTWGIFQNKQSNNQYIIFLSTHNQIGGSSTQQAQIAQIANNLITQFKKLQPNVSPTVIIAGDFNTADVHTLAQQIKEVSLKQYNISFDSILTSSDYSNPVNYHQFATALTDHSPIADTIN